MPAPTNPIRRPRPTAHAGAAGGPDAPPPRGAAVVVMARSPSGGRAPKTRLAGAVPDEEDRRKLYAAFLTDVVAACRAVEGAALRVAYTPDGGRRGFAAAGVGDGERPRCLQPCGPARHRATLGASLAQRKRDGS